MGKKLRVAIGVVAVSGSGLLGFGAPLGSQQIGPEFRVNESTEGVQWEPAIGATVDGGFVVVWSGDSAGAQQSSILGRFYDASGQESTGELRLSGATTLDHGHPAVTVNLDGTFLIVWSGRQPGTPDRFLAGRRFEADGDPLGGEIAIAADDLALHYDLAVSAVGGGSLIVVWRGVGTPGIQVFGRLYDDAGSPVGDPFQISAEPGGAQGRPAIAGRAHAALPGEFVVVWHGYTDSTGSYDVFARRIDASGNPIGDAFRVHEGTTSAQRDPAVAMNGDGEFVVVWSELVEGTSRYETRARSFDAVGAAAGPSFLVNAESAYGNDTPTVAADGTGEFVVAWRSRPWNGFEDEVLARRVSTQGRTVGGELTVNTYTTGNQNSPNIAGDLQGRVIVAWSSENQDGSVAGVFGQRLEGPLLADGFESGDVCSWSTSAGGEGCP